LHIFQLGAVYKIESLPRSQYRGFVVDEGLGDGGGIANFLATEGPPLAAAVPF